MLVAEVSYSAVADHVFSVKVLNALYIAITFFTIHSRSILIFQKVFRFVFSSQDKTRSAKHLDLKVDVAFKVFRLNFASTFKFEACCTL